jgi:K+-sensing histidine kinase KdpD
LAIANRIVSAHRGVIELKARQPQGLEVSLGIPFDGDSTSKSFG